VAWRLASSIKIASLLDRSDLGNQLLTDRRIAVRLPGHRLRLLIPFGKAHFQQAAGELSLHRDGGDRRHGAERVDNDTDIALGDRGAPTELILADVASIKRHFAPRERLRPAVHSIGRWRGRNRQTRDGDRRSDRSSQSSRTGRAALWRSFGFRFRQQRTPAGPGSGEPRTTRTQPGGLRALSPLIRRLARPLSERQRDAHCGIAYFVGEHAILDRARQHHTANA
jgi:hypothetical protein